MEPALNDLAIGHGRRRRRPGVGADLGLQGTEPSIENESRLIAYSAFECRLETWSDLESYRKTIQNAMLLKHL